MFGGMSDQAMADVNTLNPVSWSWQEVKFSKGI